MKIKLTNLGVKPPAPLQETVVKSERRVHYPFLYLSDEELPEVVDLKGGQRVSLIFDAVVQEISVRETDGGKARANVTFKLTHGAIKEAILPKTTLDALIQTMGENDA